MLNRRDLIKHFGETLFETTLKKEEELGNTGVWKKVF